jgi:hypothetical protein
MKKIYLGIIYKNDEIHWHRSLAKIIFNPFLRFFGYELVSWSYTQKVYKDQIGVPFEMMYRIFPCTRRPNLIQNMKESWCFEFDEQTMKVLPIRKIW